MADFDRAFIPPTETEVVDNEAHTVVWSLGSLAHPWKNIYIMDYDTPGAAAIDVYTALKDIALMPEGEKHAGMVLSVASNDISLEWKNIDDVLSANASGSTLLSIIGANSVQRATADEDGLPFKTGYLKNTDLTAQKIANTLGSLAIERAVCDGNGNNIAASYVDRTYLSNNYIRKGGLRDEEDLADIAFSGAWEDIQGRPTIPDLGTVQAMINDKFDPLNVRVTTNETNIAAIQEELATTVVHKSDTASATSKGILAVNSGNGLTLSADTILSINKATQTALGTVKVKNGNGLKILETGDNAGEISMSIATTKSHGAAKLGEVITSTASSITTIPSDGRWYKWTGNLKIGDTSPAEYLPTSGTDIFLIRKWYVNEDTTYSEAKQLSDPRITLQSMDNGANWFAQYAVWHA